MSRFLMIDVGAGTMDILYFDEDSAPYYKAVVKSPVKHVAETVSALSGNLVTTGCEMGGGAVSSVLKQRARNYEVVMSASSAATIHHDPEKVQATGIRIVDDREAEEWKHRPGYHPVTLGDLDMDRLEGIVEGFGVPFSFDVVGVCAQDHGISEPGVSHLDFRHNIFKSVLDAAPYPHALLYEKSEVPSTLNRLTAIAEAAGRLPTQEVYVMDSGMAAILGASMDMAAMDKEKILVLDLATSHTLGAALAGEKIAGFFEYHTRDITLARLEQLLPDLADGKLSHERILKEGGHGAYIREAFGFENVEVIIATGPKRRLAKGAGLPIFFSAPFGDNMMTGTVGLLEAIRRRKNLSPIQYV